MRRRTLTIIFALTACLALAPLASAEVVGTTGGFTYVKKERTLPGSNSTSSVDATAVCPDGMVRTGGGATVTGAATGTALAASGTPTNKQWFGEAWHTGINADKKLTTWGVCTSKASKVSDLHDPQSVGAGPVSGYGEVECENGSMVGGGVRTSGAAEDWWLNSLFPLSLANPNPDVKDGWRSFVHHLAGSTASSVITDAICMEGETPTYKSKNVTTDVNAAVTLKAECPKSKSVTGGGAFMSGNSSQAHIVTTAPIDNKSDKDKIPDDGWKVKYFNDAGANQSFTSTAICK